MSRAAPPRRLRAIGQLFEAEDESQQWPQLHAAVRAARKAYQAEGALPDWDGLAGSVHEQGATLADGSTADPDMTS